MSRKPARRAFRPVVVVAALGLALTACSGGSDEGGDSGSQEASADQGAGGESPGGESGSALTAPEGWRQTFEDSLEENEEIDPGLCLDLPEEPLERVAAFVGDHPVAISIGPGADGEFLSCEFRVEDVGAPVVTVRHRWQQDFIDWCAEGSWWGDGEILDGPPEETEAHEMYRYEDPESGALVSLFPNPSRTSRAMDVCRDQGDGLVTVEFATTEEWDNHEALADDDFVREVATGLGGSAQPWPQWRSAMEAWHEGA